jgi:hypothetical protein
MISGNWIYAGPGMAVTVTLGVIRILGLPWACDEAVVSLTAAHETLDRIDIIYRDESGIAHVADGLPDAVEDPKSLGDWKSYTSPTPSSSIPPGVILGAVHVRAGATAIESSDIWMFAAGVGEIESEIPELYNPYLDSYPPSVWAVKTALDLKFAVADIQTSIGSPGSDSKVPSEKAVRTELASYAPAAKGVTNGDSHDHKGGDGAQITHADLAGLTADDHTQYIKHSLATAVNDFLAASGSGVFVKKTLAEVKTILGLGSAAYTESSAYAVAAKGVTGGDSHNSLHSAAFLSISAKAADSEKLDGYDSADFWRKAETVSYATAAGSAGSATSATNAGNADTLDGNHASAFLGASAKAADSDKLDNYEAADFLRKVERPEFGVDFSFGDGSAVLEASAATHRMPLASAIKKAYIRSLDTDGGLKSGSITVTIYVHDYNAAIGSAVDSYALSSASSYAETGLNIAVAAGKFITAITSGITTCEQIVLSLELEAT